MPELVRVEGLHKLASELSTISRDLPSTLDAASTEAAETVAGRSRSIAPRRTGRLAGDVHTEPLGYIVVDLVYGPPIIFGWAAHNIEPQPFLFDALDESAEAITGQVAAKVDELLATITPGTGE